VADPRTDSQQQQQPGGWLLQDVSNAMVALHKEQFGRGLTKAQSTADQFIATVETITGRTVRAFASATDADHGVVMETFIFEPDGRRDGRPPD
jgi:uncharacterized protein YbcI